jgi:hypothetical protein
VTEGDKSNRIDPASDHIRRLRGGLTRPQREHRREEPARRESNAHWRFRGPPSCPLDHGPRDAPRSRTGPRRCCGPPPAPASRASRCPRPDSNGRPAVSETAALSCCATGTWVPRDLRVTRPCGHWIRRPRDMRARGGTRTPNDRTADGFTGRCAAYCATLAWGGRRESNAQPPGSRPGALPG